MAAQMTIGGLLESGIDSLPIPDLLTLIVGSKRTEAFNYLGSRFNGLAEILQATPEELRSSGLTNPEIMKLKLIMWASDRAVRTSPQVVEPNRMSDPANVHDYLKRQMVGKKKETMVGLFMDAQMRLILKRVLFTGTVGSALVYIRDIVKTALDVWASSVIIVHNHPSGSSTPSDMDRRVTENIFKALKLVEILLLDHIIIGNQGYYSMHEKQDPPFNPQFIINSGGAL